jgi:hypothetical protein
VTLYAVTALTLACTYTLIGVWAAWLTYRQWGRTPDWPIRGLTAAAALTWAGWYWYLCLVCPALGSATALLSRTLHAPTLALLIVALAWRGRRT